MASVLESSLIPARKKSHELPKFHLFPSISIYFHLFPSISIYFHLFPSISIYFHQSTRTFPSVNPVNSDFLPIFCRVFGPCFGAPLKAWSPSPTRRWKRVLWPKRPVRRCGRPCRRPGAVRIIYKWYSMGFLMVEWDLIVIQWFFWWLNGIW